MCAHTGAVQWLTIPSVCWLETYIFIRCAADSVVGCFHFRTIDTSRQRDTKYKYDAFASNCMLVAVAIAKLRTRKSKERQCTTENKNKKRNIKKKKKKKSEFLFSTAKWENLYNFFILVSLYSNHSLISFFCVSFRFVSICVLNLILFSLLRTLWWRNRSLISRPYANVVLCLCYHKQFNRILHVNNPFPSIRAHCDVYIEIVIIFSLCISKIVGRFRMLLAYSIIVIICHTISFNTISFSVFFFPSSSSSIVNSQ